MYKIYMQNLSDASPTLIYQSDNKSENLIIEPKLSFEWQQHGSLDFSMLPGHPAYSDIHSMITFVTVYWDDEELFYGRVVTVDKSLHGQKDVYCEGALSFLSDGEVQAYDGSTTAQAFFSKCLTDYNSTVESRKQFSLGTCEFTDSGIYFKMEENTEARSALDEQLVKRLGGCMVVRKTPFGHSLNYLKQVGSSSSQKIRICENVQDRTDHDSGESLFTILRPIGANDIDTHETVKLSGSGVIEIPAMIAKYGRITKTENFSDQTTEAGLRAEAEKYIERLGMSTDKLPVTVDFSFVDFHYLNPSITRIHFGDVFEDIEGYEGESLVVGALELDLEDPKNDTLSLYNKTYLDAREYSALLESATGSASRGGSGGRGSSLAKALSSLEETEEEKFWKHVHATDDALMLFGDRIQLAADILIGSTREYDVLASDVEELYGTHLHGNGNGFWEMYGKIYKDSEGNISIKDGAGLRVERTKDGVTTSYGVYDDDTLTAGVMIDKMNADNTTYILGDKVIIGNASVSYTRVPLVGNDPTVNPRQSRFYELKNGVYVLSDDTTYLAGKNYYVKNVVLPGDGSGTSANTWFEKTEDRIGFVVQGTGPNKKLNVGEMVLEINQQTGQTISKIRADRILIDSNSGSSFEIDANGVMSLNAENAIAAINAATAEINANKIALNAAGTVTLSSKVSITNSGYIALNGVVQTNDDLYVGEDLILNDGYTITFAGPYDDLTFYPKTARFGNFAVTKQILAHDDLKVGLDAVVNGGQIEIKFADNSDGNHNSANFNIAATQFYQDGLVAEWAAAYAMVDMPDLNISTGSFDVKVPSSTRGQQDTHAFTVQKDSTPSASGNVSVYMNNLTVARISIGDWYTAGDTAGYTRGYTVGDTDGYNRAANQRTTLTATSNGTYTPSFGYSSVVVNVPSSSIAVNDIQLYASNYQQGTQSQTGVTTSLGYNSDGSNPVRIFSNTVFQLDKWYCFKITVNGVSKGYYFKASS